MAPSIRRRKEARRKVAIKVLRPEITARWHRAIPARDRNRGAPFASAHVPLIDSGEAGGLLYYVQPHVPGGSLRERLADARQLSLKDALRIAQEVGAGLDFATATALCIAM